MFSHLWVWDSVALRFKWELSWILAGISMSLPCLSLLYSAVHACEQLWYCPSPMLHSSLLLVSTVVSAKLLSQILFFSVQMRWKLLNEIKPTQVNKATVIIRADLVTTWIFSAKRSLREEKVPVETQWLRKHGIRRDAELYKVCCVRPPTTFTKGNLRTKVLMVS